MSDIKINPCRHCKHIPGLSNPTVTEYKLRCFNPLCYEKHGENSITTTSQLAAINLWNEENPEQQEEEMVLYKAKWPHFDFGLAAEQSNTGGDPYSRLRSVMEAAIDQAANGKGKERHANENENFEDQKIVEISKRLQGHVSGGPLFQVVKKVYESGRLNKEMALNELYGAMNYLAAAIIVLEDC